MIQPRKFRGFPGLKWKSSEVAPPWMGPRVAVELGARPFRVRDVLDREAEFEGADSYLSLLFALEPAHADAAALRGRVSIEQGNLPFARRFLAEQVEINPDHAELREALDCNPEFAPARGRLKGLELGR